MLAPSPIFPYLSYSSDLTLCDFCLFPELKPLRGGHLPDRTSSFKAAEAVLNRLCSNEVRLQNVGDLVKQVYRI